MNKSIYSLVLSDEVVDAVDALARSAGLSRSAMINRILAERVAFVKPTGSTLSARTSLKYRYKPTVKYSVEMFFENGVRAGELRVSYRSQNAQLIGDLTEFFRLWAKWEEKYIADKINADILYTIGDMRFTRTLNMPRGEVSEETLGETVADYMAMLDGAMKEYFLELPDKQKAAERGEEFYKNSIARTSVII